MVSDLDLSEDEKLLVEKKLRKRTRAVEGEVKSENVVDYVEAALKGIICELIINKSIKWRETFFHRFAIKEI